MNDLLWLANHPLQGHVMGISTSRDPDTPEGLESWLSVGIHRILTELPHSTELELEKLRQTWMDSSRASMLKLLRGLLRGREVLWPSESRLSLYSTKIEFGSHLGGGGKPHFLHTFSLGSTVVFIGGVRRCSGRRLGVRGPLVRPASHATWPGGQVSSLHRLWALDTLSTASAGHIDKMVFGNAPTLGQSATPWVSWAHALCHIISSCHIFCDYALFWT
jgi:hypothetical protein